MALRITRLREDHQVDAFRNSREPEIERFLREQALQEQSTGASVTYVLFDDAAPATVIGYYTMCPASVRPEHLPSGVIAVPDYPTLGAFLLARMGVGDNHRGRELGTTLLSDAYRRCLYLIYDGGGIGLLVDPKNDRLVAYYADHGFTALEKQRSRRMFIPPETMAEIVRAAEQSVSDGADDMVS